MAEIGEEVLRKAHRAFRDDDAITVSQILAEQPELRKRINEPVGPFHSPAVVSVRSRQMLDALLDAGADINARSDWWAGSFGILDMAKPDLAMYAIRCGAIVDVHSAARLDLLDDLKRMIEADPSLVHAKGGDGQTPLHFANSIEIAEYLLEHGADIDALDIDHVSTPAQYMVRGRPEVARYLIARGCKTDILMATALGDADLVAEHLKRDPESIRTRVSDEYFPLINGDNGGSIYQWELGWYVSAHQVARQFGYPSIFELLWNHSPADVKLVAACWLGDESTVDTLLLENPGLVATLQPAEQRQLAHAARNNELRAVLLMLKAGLPVAERSQHRATTLHWAAWHGNLEMAKVLLASGASVTDSENDYSSTPLSWALYASVEGWDPAGGDYAATVESLITAGSKLPAQQSGSPAVRGVLATHGVKD